MTRSLRFAFAGLWVAAMVAGAAWLNFELGPGVPQIPDVGHIAAHIVLFAVLAGVLGRELSVPAAIAVCLGAGLGVEIVQMIGFHRLQIAEATFDSSVNLVGTFVGLRLTRPADALPWVERAFHPALVTVGMVAATGVPPLWFVAIAAFVALAAIPAPATAFPWGVLVPLLLAPPAALEKPRIGLVLVLIALLRTTEPHPGRMRAWVVGWLFACGLWAAW